MAELGNIIDFEDWKKAHSASELTNNRLNINQLKIVKVSCLHDACPRCLGSGIRRDTQGICIHHTVCRCEKCVIK